MICMSQCSSGGCSGCGGCAKTLTLTPQEIHMLRTLGQIPFLPVARQADNIIPVYLEDSAYTREEYSIILQVLEQKGLISLDYHTPISGADMSAYNQYPVRGSMALTAKGQLVVDMLDRQGIQEE